MLCPEVWDFKAPKHFFAIEKGQNKPNDVPSLISTHYFNHSVSFFPLIGVKLKVMFLRNLKMTFGSSPGVCCTS